MRKCDSIFVCLSLEVLFGLFWVDTVALSLLLLLLNFNSRKKILKVVWSNLLPRGHAGNP